MLLSSKCHVCSGVMFDNEDINVTSSSLGLLETQLFVGVEKILQTVFHCSII